MGCNTCKGDPGLSRIAFQSSPALAYITCTLVKLILYFSYAFFITSSMDNCKILNTAGFVYRSQKRSQVRNWIIYDVVKVPNGHRSEMADEILKFMIGHIGLGSNVQLCLVDFKVCDWPPETSLNGQSQTLKSCWPIKTSLSWLITNFKIPRPFETAAI